MKRTLKLKERHLTFLERLIQGFSNDNDRFYDIVGAKNLINDIGKKVISESELSVLLIKYPDINIDIKY